MSEKKKTKMHTKKKKGKKKQNIKFYFCVPVRRGQRGDIYVHIYKSITINDLSGRYVIRTLV